MHLHLVTIHATPSAQAVPLAAASLKSYLDARPAPARPVTVTCAEFFSGTPTEEVCSAILARLRKAFLPRVCGSTFCGSAF